MVSLLVLAYAFGVADCIFIGLLTQSTKADPNLSDTGLGIIQGFTFRVFYALLALPIDIGVDCW